MRKLIVIVMVLILVALIGAVGYTYFKPQSNSQADALKSEINSYLYNSEYQEAFSMINEENSQYIDVLNNEIYNYANSLCEEALANLSADKLLEFKNAGGNYEIVNNAIREIETKTESNRIASENYVYAVYLYESRDFDAAKQYFDTIIPEDENYQNAQNYIAEMKNRDESWSNSTKGKIGYLNALAFDGEYLYVPFVLDGVDGIYKIDKNGNASEFFPLSYDAGTLVIKSINVVGDYIYFIAGENIGSGYTFESPYCIYEMKTDGSNLAVAAEGNFTDLYIKDDKAYAISREFGLLEYNMYFSSYNTIAQGIVPEFSVTDEGIYYTVQESYRYDNVNSVYFYNGAESELIESKAYLHYYDFGDKYLKEWKYSSSMEIINYGAEGSETSIRSADMCNIYGILEGQILYSRNGSLGREVLYTYQISDMQTLQISGDKEVLGYSIKGIFYEQDKLVIEKAGKLYFSNIAGTAQQEIINLQINDSQLQSNSEIIRHLSNEDIYEDSADAITISVISDKQNWHYKDDNLNITIEKRYVEKYDCNVYVTHIFTNDYSLFTTGNALDSDTSNKTYTAATISDKYHAIYAQNTDTFLDSRNTDRGIIIRNGKVVRTNLLYDMVALFDDGSMKIYRNGDSVTGEQLVADGAMLSFSFGPILVENYEINRNCAAADLAERNPRSAVGYVEPGHYVMIACDGRDNDVSRGLNMIQLAQLFEDEGCSLAYNLDGGMTTVVLFMGNHVTHRPAYKSGNQWFFYRKVAEIFYVGTSGQSPMDLDAYTYDYSYYMDNVK